jgi:hypothetical protein
MMPSDGRALPPVPIRPARSRYATLNLAEVRGIRDSRRLPVVLCRSGTAMAVPRASLGFVLDQRPLGVRRAGSLQLAGISQTSTEAGNWPGCVVMIQV